MPVDSWTPPEETPALAASAAAMIDAALTGSGLLRDAYWSAVRKGYNTPYNDPPRKRAVAPAPVEIVLTGIDPAETGLLPWRRWPRTTRQPRCTPVDETGPAAGPILPNRRPSFMNPAPVAAFAPRPSLRRAGAAPAR